MKLLLISIFSLILGSQSAFAKGGSRPVPHDYNDMVTLKFFSCDYEKQIKFAIIPGVDSSKPTCQTTNFEGKLVAKYDNNKVQNLDFNTYEVYVPRYNAVDSILKNIEVIDKTGSLLGLEKFTDVMIKYYSNVEVGLDAQSLRNPLVQMLSDHSMMGNSIRYTNRLSAEDLKLVRTIFESAIEKYHSDYDEKYTNAVVKGLDGLLARKEDQSLSIREAEYLIRTLRSLERWYELSQTKTVTRFFITLAEKIKINTIADYAILAEFPPQALHSAVLSEVALDDELLAQMPAPSFDELKSLALSLSRANDHTSHAKFLLRLLEKQIVSKKIALSIPEIMTAVFFFNYRNDKNQDTSIGRELFHFLIQQKLIKSLTELAAIAETTKRKIEVLYPESRTLFAVYLDTTSESFQSMMNEDLKTNPNLKNPIFFFSDIFSKFFYPFNDFYWRASYEYSYDHENQFPEQYHFFAAYLRARGERLGQSEVYSLTDRGFFCDQPEVFKLAVENLDGNAADTLTDFLKFEMTASAGCKKYSNPDHIKTKFETATIIKKHSTPESIKTLTEVTCKNADQNLEYPTAYYWCKFLKTSN